MKYNEFTIMPELQTAGPAEHIDEAEVLRRFEEKRRLIESIGGKSEAKEIFREAFREHAAAVVPPAAGSIPAPAPAAASLPGHIHHDDSELSALVGLALGKGIGAAVRKVKVESPYLIDAFHDELADHYYEKLVAAGLLKPE